MSSAEWMILLATSIACFGFGFDVCRRLYDTRLHKLQREREAFLEEANDCREVLHRTSHLNTQLFYQVLRLVEDTPGLDSERKLDIYELIHSHDQALVQTMEKSTRASLARSHALGYLSKSEYERLISEMDETKKGPA